MAAAVAVGKKMIAFHFFLLVLSCVYVVFSCLPFQLVSLGQFKREKNSYVNENDIKMKWTPFVFFFVSLFAF